MKQLLFVCAWLFFANVFSQDILSQMNRVDLELRADENFESYNFKEALLLYQEIESIDSVINSDIQFKIGVCCLETNHYQDALYYLKLAESSKKELIDSYSYYLAKAYQLNGKVVEAKTYYLEYLDYIETNEDLMKFSDEIKREIQKCETAQKYYDAELSVHVKLMSKSVNSIYGDYDPLISADESVMYFTSDRPHEFRKDVHELDGTAYEDIYRSVKTDTGWSQAEKVKELDAELDNACVALSHDGQRMIIYRSSKKYFWSKVRGHLYLSEIKNGKWTKPQLLSFSDNDESNEVSACFSIDDKTIYFSSDREGGYGGKDLYKVERVKKGWGTPVNLGAEVNTQYDEDSPFVHPDGTRFYFSSTGHENMGGYDVFTSKLDVDGKISEVRNFGYPVNTTTDEISFVVGGSAKKAYVADNREGGYGEMDIYELHFYNHEEDVTVFKGMLSDSLTGEVVDATIKVYEEDGVTLHSVYHTNPSSGKFVVLLHDGGSYVLSVEKKGYNSYKEPVFIHDKHGYHEIQHMIVLMPN